MNVKKILYCAILTIFPATEALPSGIENWSGIYSGLQAGWISIDNEYSVLEDSYRYDLDIRTDGLAVGAFVGMNWKNGDIILGIEGDIAFSGANSSNDRDTDHSASSEWFGTLRGRAGILIEQNILVYATAGLALMDNNFEHLGKQGLSDTLIGWAAGAGMEYATKEGVRFGIEAIYMDFDSGSSGNSPSQKSGSGSSIDNDPSGILGRARIIVPIN